MACSGRTDDLGSSHLGPPTAPRSTASLSFARRRAESVNATPCASIEQPPASARSQAKLRPNRLSVIFRTSDASPTTSGPMPSPANTATLYAIVTPRFRFQREGGQCPPYTSRQSETALDCLG